MNERCAQKLKAERLSDRDRYKVVAISLAFCVIFSGVFVVIVMFGEPLRDLRQYPLDPRGWFIVDRNGSFSREANLWDMVKAKYVTVLYLAGYIIAICFTAYLFCLGVQGRRNSLTKYILAELSRKSFRLESIQPVPALGPEPVLVAEPARTAAQGKVSFSNPRVLIDLRDNRSGIESRIDLGEFQAIWSKGVLVGKSNLCDVILHDLEVHDEHLRLTAMSNHKFVEVLSGTAIVHERVRTPGEKIRVDGNSIQIGQHTIRIVGANY